MPTNKHKCKENCYNFPSNLCLIPADALGSVALTGKVPNEERRDGQEDEKPHEDADQGAGLALGHLLLVAEEVDPLVVVAVPALVRRNKRREKVRKHTLVQQPECLLYAKSGVFNAFSGQGR